MTVDIGYFRVLLFFRLTVRSFEVDNNFEKRESRPSN